MRIMRFCSAGTEASPTSTARSPRATMMPSQADMMSSSAPGATASARSILAIRKASPPAARSSCRAMYMSALDFGNDTARKSTLIAAAVRMSSMSLVVSAAAVRPPPRRLMPLLFDSTPPWTTRQCTSLPLTRSTLNSMRPSSSSSTSPALTSRGSSL